MRKSMLWPQYLLLASILFLYSFVFYSCKKTQFNEIPVPNAVAADTKFFDLKSNVNPAIVKISKDLQSKNAKTEFVSNFIKYAGYPKWEKAFALTKQVSGRSVGRRNSNSDSTYVIPIVSQNDKFVTGAYVVSISDTVSYRLILLKNYQAFKEKKLAMIRDFMALDLRVYGYKEFKINDTSTMNGVKTAYFKRKQSALRTSSVNTEDPCDILELWEDPTNEPCHCSGDEYYTGEWKYRDADNCYGTPIPQPTLSFIDPNDLPSGYYFTDPNTGGPIDPPPPYVPVPSTLQEKTDYLIQKLTLDQTQQFYLVNTEGAVETLFNYYYYTNNTPEGKDMVIWALSYFSQNYNTNVKAFANQFLQILEKNDGAYDEAYWNDPNNTFPRKTLPTWAAFKAAYPKVGDSGNMDAPDVFNSVGGQIKTMRDNSLADSDPSNDMENACALRLSWALNGCGISIPHISGQTFQGKDGKYYFLGAKNMNMWLRRTFGCANPDTSKGEYLNPDAVHFNSTQAGVGGGNLPALLAGKKGIYSIVTHSSWASGHCDMLWSDATCIGGCHFDAPIFYGDVWNLK